jgi:hypothetical protein
VCFVILNLVNPLIEIEFVYKKLNIFGTTSASSGVLVLELKMHFRTPDDALVVRNILSFLYTNSMSVCETT